MPATRLFPADWLDVGSDQDVPLGLLKAGKESEVHLVARTGTSKTALLAENRFKAWDRRSFRDDSTYRGVWGQGTRRESRAMRKNTRYGHVAVHARWIAHELATLVRLADAGVTVPPPVEPTEDGYRMAFIGDGARAAPRLSETRLDPRTATRVWAELEEEVARMLAADVVHGDLSAFNVLWWRGRAVLIDLSQAGDALTHPAARDLLVRDVERLAGYFRRHRVAGGPRASLARRRDSPPPFARPNLSS